MAVTFSAKPMPNTSRSSGKCKLGKPEIRALKFTVPHEEIYYISWIIDASEGIGFLQTDDAKAGYITVFSPASQEEYLMSLIQALRLEGISVKEGWAGQGDGEAIE